MEFLIGALGLLHTQIRTQSNVVHQNYVGIDSEKNPYFLSIVSHESGNKSTLYRAMLFRKQVCILFYFE